MVVFEAGTHGRTPAVPAGWHETTLGQLVALQRGFDLPASRRRQGPYPIVSSGGVSGWHDSGPVAGPGFAIGRAANLGVPVWSEGHYWPLNTTLFVEDFHGNDPRFVYYLMHQLDLSGYNSGSVQPMLNRNYVSAVPLVVPAPDEQRRIARTLRALDDKIATNRRLQKAASGLATAMVGTATRGADLVEYKRVMSVVMGSAFKGDAFSASGTGRPLLRIRDLKTFVSQTWTTEERADETLIRPGDIVVGMDAEFRATLWQGMPSLLNQRVCAFRPHDGVSRAFVLSALAPQLAFFEKAKSGTTVIHLNKADIDRFLVPRLDNDQHAQLTDQTEPLLDVVVNASAQSVRLAALRDALLPELLSARIRVPEASEAVESALA